jgi:hypothetical protein
MAINTGKVIVGGLAAGLVLNVSGFVVQGMLLGPRMMAEMAAVAPSLASAQPGAGEIAGRVLTQFAVGIMLVWIYALIRPRLGPGPKTAMVSAIVVWIFGFLFYLDWVYAGMMTAVTYAIVSCVMLATLAIAAWVGAMLYKEDGAVSV